MKMKTSKPVLLAIAFAALALLGVALYLQFGERMLPCPKCVLQRYAYTAIALICLVTALLPKGATRVGAGLGLLAALSGIGFASWHLWVMAHPSLSCGSDPLEASLNNILPAKLLPFLFRADGLCTTEYDPILGLSIPQWSLAWFVVFALALGWAAFRRQR